MTTKAKPGNQPDPAETLSSAAEDGAAADPANIHPKQRDVEEEAARLGDFA